MNIKPKLLLLLHLPPPIHGSSIVGMNIKKSAVINDAFECVFINLLASTNIADSGKISLKKIFGFLTTLKKVLKSIIEERPELCYLALTSTGAAFYRDLIVVILLKIFRVKLVFHLHNKGIRSSKNNFIANFFYSFIFNNVDVIILSEHLYADIQYYVPKSRVYICPNGVNDESSNNDKEYREKNIKSSTTRILFLSNLIESKGVFLLLEALFILKQKKIEFECTFIGGEGEIKLSEFNKQCNKLDLEEYIFYKGKKYGQEKRQALLEADIFALPTYYSKECFPLVLLEAMSFGLPVISTFEGGISDIVEDSVTGFLVKQKHVQSLAEKLEFLINSPYLRQKMGEAGRRKFEEEFTLPKFEQTFVGIIQQVVNKQFG